MKNLSTLETTIIGFLIGVVVSAYMTFIIGTDGFMGNILYWVSLKPIFDTLAIPDSSLLIATFLFFVCIYTIYGLIIGLIIKNNRKIIPVFIFIFLALVVIIFLQQKKGIEQMIIIPDMNVAQVSSFIKATPKVPQTYFGTEALGDLNSDGKDDVAFIIKRADEERGVLHYLSTALATTSGRMGTNLIFLGEKRTINSILINEGVIFIEYSDQLLENATSTIKAKVTDGVLEQIENVI